MRTDPDYWNILYWRGLVDYLRIMINIFSNSQNLNFAPWYNYFSAPKIPFHRNQTYAIFPHVKKSFICLSY